MVATAVAVDTVAVAATVVINLNSNSSTIKGFRFREPFLLPGGAANLFVSSILPCKISPLASCLVQGFPAVPMLMAYFLVYRIFTHCLPYLQRNLCQRHIPLPTNTLPAPPATAPYTPIHMPATHSLLTNTLSSLSTMAPVHTPSHASDTYLRTSTISTLYQS